MFLKFVFALSTVYLLYSGFAMLTKGDIILSKDFIIFLVHYTVQW